MREGGRRTSRRVARRGTIFAMPQWQRDVARPEQGPPAENQGSLPLRRPVTMQTVEERSGDVTVVLAHCGVLGFRSPLFVRGLKHLAHGMGSNPMRLPMACSFLATLPERPRFSASRTPAPGRDGGGAWVEDCPPVLVWFCSTFSLVSIGCSKKAPDSTWLLCFSWGGGGRIQML